jgi:hypothetical protein
MKWGMPFFNEQSQQAKNMPVEVLFDVIREFIDPLIRQLTGKETPWQNLITSSRNVRKN